MPSVDIPVGYDVKLSLREGGPQYFVRVLDVNHETIVLRVPNELVSDEFTPERVTLSFGFRNFAWEVPASANAVYDHWWFVERPDELACRRFQRRAFVRIAFEAGMAVIPMRHGIQCAVNVQTENISANGCLVKTPQSLGSIGDPLMVRLSLPGLPQVSTISELVRVVDGDQDEPLYGIHFKGLKGHMQEQLAQFIADRIRGGLIQGQDITCAEQN
ncbi:MAG TPA: PilZ domain-containing protein [Oscillatoriaceae cyanobacterium]